MNCAHRTVKDVVDLAPDFNHTGTVPVPGASILLRDKEGISLSLETTELPEGAYSIWLFVFNNPDGCHHPRVELGGQCGAPDTKMHDNGDHVNVDSHGGPARGGVMWATGGVVGMDGIGDFQARIEKIDPPGPVLRGPGLTNTLGAEIVIIARHHGSLLLGRVDEQISQVNGGCPPRTCVSVQDSVHPAP